MFAGAAAIRLMLSKTKTGAGAVNVLALAMCVPETLKLSSLTISFDVSLGRFVVGAV
jgi:hypothetical protein